MLNKLEPKPKLDRRLQIVLDKELEERSKLLAEENNMSFSELVRIALHKLVGKKK